MDEPCTIELELVPPFYRQEANCWTKSIAELGLGDVMGAPNDSTLALFEEELLLGPAHSSHAEIRMGGAGRFSHWNGVLYFSTSDNSDPNSNGRSYVARLSDELYFRQHADYAISIVDFWLKMLGNPATIAGRRVMEIGPGRDMGTAMILSAMGAEITVVEKYAQGWVSGFHEQMAGELLRRLEDCNWPLDLDKIRQQLESHDFGPSIVLVRDGLEDLPTHLDGSFDLSFSHSVLEHLAEPTAAMRALYRASSREAVGIHRVDFRDHADFARPLDFLLLTDEAFENYCPVYRYGYGNRVRADGYAAILSDAGFRQTFTPETLVDPAYLQGFVPHLRTCTSRFREVDETSLHAASGVFRLWKD